MTFRSARAGTIAARIAAAASLVMACDPAGRLPDGPPPTRTVLAADTVGGVIVHDPFRWLEDDAHADVRAWVAAQNEWTRTVLGTLPGRNDLLTRIVELLRIDVATQPVVRGDRYFFMKSAPDQQRFAIYLREGRDGIDSRLIDPFNFSDSVPPHVSLLSVTADGGVVAYSVRRGESQEAEVRFFDVTRRVDLPFRLPPARYTGVEMLADRSGIYYARADDDASRLWFHSVAGPAADSVVFGSSATADGIIAFALSANARWLAIVVFHGTAGQTTDVWFADLRAGADIRLLTGGVAASFLPTFAGDTILLHTDWNAPNGRVLRVSLQDPARDRWVEIIPERDDAVIEGVAAIGVRLLVNTLENAYSHLTAYDIDGVRLGTLALPFPGSVEGITGGWENTEAFFSYETFHVPPGIRRYDAATGEVSEWFEPHVAVPSLAVRQEWAVSADTTLVPVFLVYRQGLPQDGRNSALLTGFGGFGASLAPGFIPEAVITAERGGVFAVAIARGGGEFDEAWREAGKGEGKARAIDDFMAAAEWLIDRRYTSALQLGAIGATHGGMLVASAMARRPDLFGAVVARFPLLDMARFPQGGTARSWIAEYGSPQDPDVLPRLLEYSPYHTVAGKAGLPPVLLVASPAAPVPPFHARKMIGRLQETGGPGPFLLREDTTVAASVAGPLATVEGLADMLGFVFAHTSRDAIPGPRS